MPKITAPVEGFTGTTYLGEVTLKFTDGVAELKDGILNAGHIAYLQGAGYKVTGVRKVADHPGPTEVADQGKPNIDASKAAAVEDKGHTAAPHPAEAGTADTHLVNSPDGADQWAKDGHSSETDALSGLEGPTPGEVPEEGEKLGDGEPGVDDGEPTQPVTPLPAGDQTTGDPTAAAAPVPPA